MQIRTLITNINSLNKTIFSISGNVNTFYDLIMNAKRQHNKVVLIIMQEQKQLDFIDEILVLPTNLTQTMNNDLFQLDNRFAFLIVIEILVVEAKYTQKHKLTTKIIIFVVNF